MTTRTDTSSALLTHKRVRATVKWIESGAVRGELVVNVAYQWQAIDELKAEGMVPDDDCVIELRREPKT